MRASSEVDKVEYGHFEHAEGPPGGSVRDAEDKTPHTPPPSFTREENKRVRRKADFVLLPIFCCIYALGFLDKTALTYASVMGIRTAAKLTISQYAWLGSIYYFGYLAGTYPMAVMHQRLPAAKFVGVTIILWGTTTAVTAACHTYAQLMGVRFLLGFLEATITPAVVMFTAEWYRKGEQATRVGIWASFSTWGGILGAGVAYGLSMREAEAKWGNSGTTMAIASWKAIFLFLGGLTILIGIVFLAIVPDSIEKAWFLKPREKEIARLRTLENKQHIAQKSWKWYQVKEALLDPQVWMICLILTLANIPGGGITNFYAILVLGMGFTVQETLLLSMANAWLSICVILTLWIADKVKCRSLVGLGPTLVAIAGGAMVWGIPREHKVARLIGFYLSLAFAIPQFVATTFVTTNIAGRTKKTIVTGLFLLSFCTGNLIGPQTFRDKDAPTYAPALLTFVICNALNLGLLVCMFFYYRWQNLKRDREYGKPMPIDDDDFVDLTDRENTSFRYVS